MMDKKQLKRTRMSLGLNQRQAAKLFGLTPEGYNRIETGKKNIPIYVDTILFACQADENLFAALKARRGLESGIAQ